MDSLPKGRGYLQMLWLSCFEVFACRAVALNLGVASWKKALRHNGNHSCLYKIKPLGAMIPSGSCIGEVGPQPHRRKIQAVVFFCRQNGQNQNLGDSGWLWLQEYDGGYSTFPQFHIYEGTGLPSSLLYRGIILMLPRLNKTWLHVMIIILYIFWSY